jgi:L-iditol 2-dehydrogenase
MKTVRLHGPGDIRLAEEPMPKKAPGMNVVRVTAVGICGSDLHWWGESGIGDTALEQPLILGHEAAGVIQDGPRRGERVAIDPAVWCGDCQPCSGGHRNLCKGIRFAGHAPHDGAMREYLSWPTHLLHRLPDVLTDADGAMLEPLGVALHALDLGHFRFGGTAVVVGCGPIGLLMLQTLRAAGATRVTAFEPLAHRRAAAIRSGADVVLSPDEVSAANLADVVGDGVDTAFEVAGSEESVRLAMLSARSGGRVVLCGIPTSDEIAFPASVARRKGLTIAMVRRMNETYPRAIRLSARGVIRLAPLITHRFGLSAASDALATAARREGLKVLVEPTAPVEPDRL